MTEKIRRIASAGTIESSDCLVTVGPSDSFALEYQGTNNAIFRKRTEALANEILRQYGIENAGITIQDQGALQITMKARIEAALERAMETADEA